MNGEGALLPAGAAVMNMPVMPSLMTAEQLRSMPEDGVDRELYFGQLREKPMTRRNPRHCLVTTKLAKLLDLWLDQQARPRGEVLTGEAGFRLRKNPDVAVGIDLAYISHDLASQTPEDAWLIDGLPILGVEILCPSDTHEAVLEKLRTYLKVGVPLVWLVDPDVRTVTVHRAGTEPEMFNVKQELSGEPELPGFHIAVAEIFRR